MTTEKLAELAQVKPRTIIALVSSTGGFYGLIPRKLHNGKLAWRSDSQEQLFAVAERKAAQKRQRQAVEAESAPPEPARKKPVITRRPA